jgi:CRISPR system Cascade subunit CasD
VSVLLLRLEGPLQSWGTLDRFGIRTTDTEPSKSGVVGLLCAAMGTPRSNEAVITAFGRLAMGVRADREGGALRDYHTAGGGTFAGEPHAVYDRKLQRPVHTVPSERHYLTDASFLVSLSGDDALLERAAVALRSPVWPLFLGRKACPPAAPVFVALEHVAVASACLRDWPRADGSSEGALRLVLEAAAGRARDDVPLSFEPRRYGRRYVEVSWTEPRVSA